MGLDEHEVPVGLGVAVDLERQLAAARRHGDRPGQALVGEVRRLRDRELVAGRRRRAVEEVGVQRVPVADPVVAVGLDVELADVDRREVGGHRLMRLPDPRRQAARGLVALQLAVGDRLGARGDGDAKLVGGLVERMVVDRIPMVGDLRLAGDERAVVGGDEARQADLGVADRRRDAVVGDDDVELLAVLDPAARRDRQLVGVARPRRRALVDGDAAHVQAVEVEVEAGEVLRRLGLDRRDALQHVGGRV